MERVAEHLLGVAALDDPAAAQHHGPLGEIGTEREVMGDVEDAEAALLQPGQKVVRDTFGTGIGAGRIAGTEPASPPAAASVSTEGEVLVAVARTDAPLDEVMRTIQQALKDHWAGACWPNRSVDTP
ncbi:hypothetical protein, partial [Micromonospora matsumotoense]|uniref:hypothetical protein n=1 Tax=Micromonospora matsumotoense TaxID=121616 RepID=UPI0034087926